MDDSQFHKYYLKWNPPIDEPDNPRVPFRPKRSRYFLGLLDKAKFERESMTVKKVSPRHDAELHFTIEEPSNSQKEYEVTISESPTCQCQDYHEKFKRKQLCKHIIWVYLYQLKVDEEHCLIQQRHLESHQVFQILKIPQVKDVLSNDERNGEGRIWYLSHKKDNPETCEAFRCKQVISPGELCVFVKGLQVLQLDPLEVSQREFYFCPRKDPCLRQMPLWSNLKFPTEISVKNDVTEDEFNTAKNKGALPLINRGCQFSQQFRELTNSCSSEEYFV